MTELVTKKRKEDPNISEVKNRLCTWQRAFDNQLKPTGQQAKLLILFVGLFVEHKLDTNLILFSSFLLLWVSL